MDRGRTIRYSIFDVGVALIAGWVVSSASTGLCGAIGKFLKIKPLVYVGTISYAIYVYHNFALHFMYMPKTAKILLLRHSLLLASLLIGGIMVSIAAFSWHVFERPINNSKQHFNYKGNRSPKKIAPSAWSHSQSDLFQHEPRSPRNTMGLSLLWAMKRRWDGVSFFLPWERIGRW